MGATTGGHCSGARCLAARRPGTETGGRGHAPAGGEAKQNSGGSRTPTSAPNRLDACGAFRRIRDAQTALAFPALPRLPPRSDPWVPPPTASECRNRPHCRNRGPGNALAGCRSASRRAGQSACGPSVPLEFCADILTRLLRGVKRSDAETRHVRLRQRGAGIRRLLARAPRGIMAPARGWGGAVRPRALWGPAPAGKAAS